MVSVDARACPMCGAAIVEAALQCPACGENLAPAESQSVAESKDFAKAKRRRLIWMLALATVSGIAAQLSEDSAREIELAEGVVVALLVTSWCSLDARQRGTTLSRLMAVGIFLFAIICLPVYLFRTRGLRGFVSLLLALAFYSALIGVQILAMVVTGYVG